MSEFPDERGIELRQLFFETALELLQSLNEDALTLEKHPEDLETVRNLRRTVHTFKGDAAACGFQELSELAHELEDALTQEATSSISLAEIGFAAADTFQALLFSYQGSLAPPSVEPLRQLIRQFVQDAKSQSPNEGKKKAGRGPAQAAWTEAERIAIQAALRQGKRVYQITIRLDPVCAMPIAARQLLLNALSASGQVLAALPESSLPHSPKPLLFALASEQTLEHIEARCRIPTITLSATVEELSRPAMEAQASGAAPATLPDSSLPDVAPSSAESEAHKANSSSNFMESALRVDAKRVDNVLNLVGELIIGKSMLQQILVEFTRLHPKDPLRTRLADCLAFQARVLNDLQHSVMKVRMVPVEQLFRRFPRLVRDVGLRCGKQAELVISGQDTDLDRSLLDAIAEPLTHLVRNGVSHGIESAEERARNNKPACGKITLDAYHEGNQVIVEVGDDGRGIDLQRVKDKAVERGLVQVEQASALSDAEILDLLFQPGFSTLDQVNEISGRGVGLDVVRSVLQRLKGTVEIVNRPGRGTTFRLKLPLTLAIMKALLFRVQGRLYAIPLNAVGEIARARENELHRVDGHEVLQLRDQALQLLRLGRITADLATYPRTRIFILVIAAGDRKLGLIVDALEGEEELVIKAMDDQTIDTDLVSGASILGDGRVVLILNLAGIIDRYNRLSGDDAANLASGLLLLHGERASHAASAGGKP